MTETSRKRKPADPVTREAAAWFSRLRADDVSEEDRARFERWLETDPRHRNAYAAFEHFWSKTGDYASERGVADATHAADQAAKAAEVHVAARAAQARARVARHSRRRYFATAASVCAMVLAVAFMVLWSGNNQAYQTGIGEQRSVMLADGSRITLNTNSRVRVSYSKNTRTVALERGQAYFRVAKEHRPFEVETRNGVVRAVGTAFDVYQRRDGMIVTVAEGTVAVSETNDEAAVSPDGITRNPARMLHAGERVALAEGSKLQLAQVEAAPVDRSVAWLGGKLVFDAEPLSQAVAEINRYSRKQVLIGDERLGTLQMSGVFRVGETGDFVRSVSEYFSLRVEADARGNYVLYPRT